MLADTDPRPSRNPAAMFDRFSLARLLTSPAGAGLLADFRPRRIAKGASPADGDITGSEIIVVTSGLLRASLAGEGREITLFLLGPGAIFCLHSPCALEALEPTEIRVIDRRGFEDKLVADPRLALGLVEIFGRAMVGLTGIIEDLMFHDVRRRVARFFSAQIDRRKGATEAARDFDVALTIEEIARLVGGSRQATSEALNDLIREGLLARPRRGRWIVTEPAALAALARGKAGPPR